MADDIQHLHEEINRLTLQTTDPRPERLFLERENLIKRWQRWKIGSITVAIFAGVIALFAFFWNDEYGVPEAGGVAIATLVLITLVARHDFNTRMNAWVAQARELVNGS